MPQIALVDATTWIGGVDYTGQSNKVMLSGKAEGLDVTTFGQGGYRTRIGGLRTAEAAIDGYWASAVDGDAVPNLGTADRVVTISPTGLAGSVAYLFQAGTFEYETGDQVGAALPFTIDLQGTNKVGLVRGQVAKAAGTVSAIGAIGSGQNLGAVGPTQFLYGTVHVLGTPGTTVTLVLESDDNAGFTSAVTQQTIGPLTAAGGTWVTRTAGAITDTFYRYRVTAITGTFTIAATVGVQ